MLFCVTCLDKPGHQDVRLANRAAHLDFARGFNDRIVIGGPLLSEDGQSMVGSMLVVEFSDLAAAQAIMAQDPYALAGLFESVTIRPYKKVLPFQA